jgi:hypothetical protein
VGRPEGGNPVIKKASELHVFGARCDAWQGAALHELQGARGCAQLCPVDVRLLIWGE